MHLLLPEDGRTAEMVDPRAVHLAVASAMSDDGQPAETFIQSCTGTGACAGTGTGTGTGTGAGGY